MAASGSVLQRTLFVAKVARRISNKDLKDHFNKYGAVVAAKVIYDTETGASKGYGFVTFSLTSEAQRAAEKPEHVIDGCKCVVKSRTGASPPEQAFEKEQRNHLENLMK